MGKNNKKTARNLETPNIWNIFAVTKHHHLHKEKHKVSSYVSQ